MKVIPYILGVLNTSDCVEDEAWRKIYIASVVKLLTSHPRLAGVQINWVSRHETRAFYRN